MKKYIEIREQMRPYTRKLMKESSETGSPIMRPLFYEFPEDIAAWEIKDEFLFGENVLVAPVTEYGQREKEVYLPAGAEWIEQSTKIKYTGGQKVTASAPLDVIPIFVKKQ